MCVTVGSGYIHIQHEYRNLCRKAALKLSNISQLLSFPSVKIFTFVSRISSQSQMYRVFPSLLFSLLFLFSSAQEKWDLEKCIRYAQENNLQIKQTRLNEGLSRNKL